MTKKTLTNNPTTPPPTATSEKIDPRVSRTRKLIEVAFAAALEEKGFAELSVQDVAERAGINRATFYAHFDDLFALLGHSVGQAYGDELRQRGLAQLYLSRDSLQKLVAATGEFIATVHRHCKPPYDHLDWLLETRIKEMVAELLVGWLNKTQPGPTKGLAVGSAACAASWALCGLASRWWQEGAGQSASQTNQSLDQMAREAVEQLAPLLGLAAAGA